MQIKNKLLNLYKLQKMKKQKRKQIYIIHKRFCRDNFEVYNSLKLLANDFKEFDFKQYTLEKYLIRLKNDKFCYKGFVIYKRYMKSFVRNQTFNKEQIEKFRQRILIKNNKI